jgi:hemolysin activation/secretion protein
LGWIARKWQLNAARNGALSGDRLGGRRGEFSLEKSALLPTQRGALVGIGLLCAGLTGGADRLAYGQAAPAPHGELPGAVEPGRDRPQPETPAQPSFDFTIEAPTRSQIPRAVEELRFTLTDIHIEGAKTLPPENFRPLYQKLIGKLVSVSQILDVADAIEDAYRQKGYVLTHAYVPPQRVKNGVFTIEVVEGYVSTVTVEGADPKTQALVKSYVDPVIDVRPLSLTALERALLLANDVPGVTAAGVLRPAPNTPGASELVVTITETKATGGLSVDNRGSRFQDVWTLGGDAEVNSVALTGDQLAASYSTSPNVLEKTSGQVRYRAPIGNNGMTASMIVTVTHGEPGASLAPFDLVTDSLAVGPRLSYPIIRTRAQSLSIDGGFTVQQANVTSLGLPFSHDQWRVTDVALTYSSVMLGGSWSGSLDAAEGLGIFGATPDGTATLSHPGADTEFTKLTASFRHVRTLIGPLSFAIAGQGQYGFAPLVAGEQITFGGSQIGRGYDPGALTGDEGVGGSFELRWDEHFPKFYLETVEPYVYFDTGKVWNFEPNQGNDLAMRSTGVGIRFFLPHAISADFEVSRTLLAVPGSDNGQKATKLLMDASIRF